MVELSLFQKGLPENGSIYRRTAARGVILRAGQLLMVHTDTGDYKFPGGGVESGESLEDALAREILEETGHKVVDKVSLWAVVHERRKGQTADILEMDSLYFFCQVDDSSLPLRLDDYEAQELFRPVWVSPEQALAANRGLQGHTYTPWLDREVMILETLIQSLEK